MSHTKLAFITLSLAVVAGSYAQAQMYTSQPAAAAPYHVAQTYHIGGEGSWDYLTVDPQHKLLYVPRSTHTMVVDAVSGETVADIAGQKRNHGVAIVPSVGRWFHIRWPRRLGNYLRRKNEQCYWQGQGR